MFKNSREDFDSESVRWEVIAADARHRAEIVHPEVAKMSEYNQNRQAQIVELEQKLKSALQNAEPIDPSQIGHLLDLKAERHADALQWAEEREEFMHDKTRALVKDCKDAHFKNRPDLFDTVMKKFAEFDTAARRWVDEEVCPWRDSQAGLLEKELSELLK